MIECFPAQCASSDSLDLPDNGIINLRPVLRRFRRGLTHALLCLALPALFATPAVAQSTPSLTITPSMVSSDAFANGGTVTLTLTPVNRTFFLAGGVLYGGPPHSNQLNLVSGYDTNNPNDPVDFSSAGLALITLSGAPSGLSIDSGRLLAVTGSGPSGRRNAEIVLSGSTLSTDTTVTVTVDASLIRGGNRRSGNKGPSLSSTFTIGGIPSTITIARGPSPILEGQGATFTLTADPPPATNQTISLTVADAPGADYVAPRDQGTQTVVMPPSGTVTYTVPTTTDRTREPDAPVRVTIRPNSGYRVGSPSSAAVQVENNTSAPGLAIKPSALTIADGRTASYTVALKTKPAGIVTIASTSDDRNLRRVTQFPLLFSSTDWRTPQTTTWRLGPTGHDRTGDTATITLTTISIGQPDYDQLAVSIPVTMTAPPPDPTVRFSHTAYSATEGEAIRVTVRLSPTRRTPTPVDFLYRPGTAGASDYNAILTRATIPAQAGSVSFDIQTTEDAIPEDDETFTLAIRRLPSGVSAGSPSAATLTIVDDDGTLPVVTITGGAAVTEGTAARFTLHADPEPAGDLLVSLGVADAPGADFLADTLEGTTGVRTIPGGQPTFDFTLATEADDTTEPSGAVTVTVRPGTGYTVGDPASAMVTVTDDDGGTGTIRPPPPPAATPAVTFALSASSAAEGVGTHPVTVTVSPPPEAGFTLTYRVSGTATAGTDFTALSESVAVAAGATRVPIPVAITNDPEAEPDETLILTLVDGAAYDLGARPVHTVTIVDDDGGTTEPADPSEPSEPATPAATFAAAASTLAENAGTHPVQVTLAPAAAVTLTYTVGGTATSGTDFTALAGSVAVAAGATRVTIPVALTNDRLAEPDETLILTLTPGSGYTLGTPRVHTLTIQDDDTPGFALSQTTVHVLDAGDQGAFTVRLTSQPRFPVTLRLTTTTTGVATVAPSTLTFTARNWQTAQRVTVRALADGVTRLTLDGDLLSGTLGVDRAQGPWLLGVAVSYTQGEGTGTDPRAPKQDLEATMTLVTPYVSLALTDRLTLWSTLGYGRGSLKWILPNTDAVDTDTTLLMATAGLRGTLREPAPTGGLALAVRSEARFLRTTAEAHDAQAVAALDDNVTLVRVGLESSWVKRLADGGSVVPRLDVGFRQDAGDAETGLGLEVGGGLRWQVPAQGLSLDLAGQTLALHADEDFETWGTAATLQWDPTPTTLTGPSLTLRQTYGGPASRGSQAFWTDDPLTTAGAASAPAALRVTAEFAWGFALGERARIGVPTLAYGWAPASRDLALGWRLPPIRSTDLTVDLTVTHREAVRTPTVQGIRLSLTRNW